MKDLRADNRYARTRDYVKEDANAHPRGKLVKKKGMEQRVENYKEELRAYEYMVSRGLIKEAKTKEELQMAVRQFKQMTSKHPERSVADAIAKLEEEYNPKKQKRTESDLNDEEEDEDDIAVPSALETENKEQLDSQTPLVEEEKKDESKVDEKDLQLANDPNSAMPDLLSPVPETATHLMPPQMTNKSSTHDQNSQNQSRFGDTLGSAVS